MIRVRLHIQNALARRGLRSVLATCDDVSVRDGEGARQLVTSRVGEQADSTVTVIDSASLKSLPVKASKEFCVLVVSDSPDDIVLNAVKQGVRRVVAESVVEEDLVRAVRATAKKTAFLSESITPYLLDCLASRLPEHTSGTRKALDRLSHREHQVLRLLGKAWTNSEIASTLRISEATVRSHIYHIVTKLDLKTRTEAVLFGHHFTLATLGQARFT